MEAKNRPLSEEERKEREWAGEEGRRMARDTMEKLKPQIKAMTDIINEANDRIYEGRCKAGVREVVEWIEKNGAYFRNADKICIHRWQAQLEKWGVNK